MSMNSRYFTSLASSGSSFISPFTASAVAAEQRPGFRDPSHRPDGRIHLLVAHAVRTAETAALALVHELPSAAGAEHLHRRHQPAARCRPVSRVNVHVLAAEALPAMVGVPVARVLRPAPLTDEVLDRALEARGPEVAHGRSGAFQSGGATKPCRPAPYGGTASGGCRVRKATAFSMRRATTSGCCPLTSSSSWGSDAMA